MIESGCCEAEEHRERAIAVATDAGSPESVAELFSHPGLPRTPNPDSATETATDAAISASQRNYCQTAQHGAEQAESDTGGRHRSDFNFAIISVGETLDLT